MSTSRQDRNRRETEGPEPGFRRPGVEHRNGDGPRPAGDPHPEAHVLAAFHDGRLDRERAREVGHHLEGCAECADLLEDYGDLEGLLYEGRAELPPERVAALRDRLPIPRPASTGVAEGGAGAEEGRARPSRVGPFLAVAAVLLVALGTVALWGLEQRREAEDLRDQVAALRQASSPETPDRRGWNHALVPLAAPGRVLRSAGAPPAVVVDPEDRALVFVLALADVETAGPYRVELRTAGEGAGEEGAGEVVWRGRVPHREADGRVTFSLLSTGLPSGLYRVGLATAAGRPLGWYPFRLERPEGP